MTEPPDLNNFASVVFSTLRQMDEEATTDINGYEAGLTGFEVHSGVSSAKFEVSVYSDLTKRLASQGYDALPDQRYPGGSRNRCDVVVRLAPDATLWLEVKLAWKAWFSRRQAAIERNSASIYRSYLLGPVEGALDRDHSVLQDYLKLSQLRPPDADFLGVLLVGFESASDPMSVDIAELDRIREEQAPRWAACGPDTWPDRACPEMNYACWFWWRPVATHP